MTNTGNAAIAAAEQIVADANRDRIAASVADVFARIGTPDWADETDEWEPSYGHDYDAADDER